MVRPSWPSAPVGVVRAKVVAKLVCDDEQVPREVGRDDWKIRLVVHGAAEPTGEVGVTNHAEVGNATGAGVASLRHQMDHVPVGASQHGVVGIPFVRNWSSMVPASFTVPPKAREPPRRSHTTLEA